MGYSELSPIPSVPWGYPSCDKCGKGPHSQSNPRTLYETSYDDSLCKTCYTEMKKKGKV